MARVAIDKAGERKKLSPRREPYWGAPVARGLFVGYRQTTDGWGTWIARWRDEDGAQKYHSIGPVSPSLDYEAARKKALEWAESKAAGVDADAVRTVKDACAEYVKDRRREKGEACAHDAEMRFKRTVDKNKVGRIRLDKLRQTKIEEWRDGLLEDGLSKSSVNRTLTALKAALNHAVARRYIASDRAIEWKQVKRFPDAGRRRDLYLDVKQRRALLKEATGAVRDLIEAAMLTGARAGELTSVRRSAFDERTASITLTGKTGTRTSPLSPAAVKLFKRLAKDKLPDAYLLTRDDGKPWAHSDWDELVRDAAARAKLPKGVCLYTCRHSFITAAILGGMPPMEVARLVGTSLTMIDQHYGHLAPAAARERLAQVELT